MTTTDAILVRVSGLGQHADNQLPDLQAWAVNPGLELVNVYEVRESAWKSAHRKALTEVYTDARAGRLQILLCWALDRLSREGVAATLEIINRLAEYKVKVWSLHESWTQVEGRLQELLLSIVAWIARMESERRSERNKAGLDRAKAAGKRLDRPPGSKGGQKRKQSGYFRRWAYEREN